MAQFAFPKNCSRILVRKRSGRARLCRADEFDSSAERRPTEMLQQIELGTFLRSDHFFGFRRQRQFKSEPLGKTLCGFGRESFEVIADKRPDIAYFGKVSLDFERPALEGGFAFPEQSVVAMNEQAVAVVFGGVIAEQPQINKIGGLGQEFERSKIAFVQRAGIGPNPANSTLFQKTNDLRPMPARVTEFDGESKV